MRIESIYLGMMEDDQRLTLAYEDLDDMPSSLLSHFAPTLEILDLSYNKFRYLNFLTKFDHLTSLVLDNNEIDSDTVFPALPNLRVLWLNNNKISRLYPFIKKLHTSCPNVLYLSLIGNLAAPSCFNGGTEQENLQYRLFVISWYTNLVHLDDRFVNAEDRILAVNLYQRPLPGYFAPPEEFSAFLRAVLNYIQTLFKRRTDATVI